MGGGGVGGGSSGRYERWRGGLCQQQPQWEERLLGGNSEKRVASAEWGGRVERGRGGSQSKLWNHHSPTQGTRDLCETVGFWQSRGQRSVRGPVQHGVQLGFVHEDKVHEDKGYGVNMSEVRREMPTGLLGL